MNEPTLSRTATLATEHAILRWLQPFLVHANKRELWVFLLDEARKPLPIIVPIEQLPDDLLRYVETPAGVVQFPCHVARLFAEVADDLGAAAAIIVWERLGDDALSQSEIDGIVALDAAFAHVGLPISTQVLCHSGGLRLITPEELEPDEVLRALQAYAAQAGDSGG